MMDTSGSCGTTRTAAAEVERPRRSRMKMFRLARGSRTNYPGAPDRIPMADHRHRKRTVDGPMMAATASTPPGSKTRDRDTRETCAAGRPGSTFATEQSRDDFHVSTADRLVLDVYSTSLAEKYFGACLLCP